MSISFPNILIIHFQFSLLLVLFVAPWAMLASFMMIVFLFDGETSSRGTELAEPMAGACCNGELPAPLAACKVILPGVCRP